MCGRARALGLVAAALVSAATNAAAAGTYSLAIGAVVLSKSICKFTTVAGGTLAFGAIDPSGSTNATASTTLTIDCKGSAATAAYGIATNGGLYSTGPGLPRMRHTVATTQFLAYTLNTPLSGTTPKNTPTPVTIVGTITPAAYQGAQVGNYADTIVLVLVP